VATEEHRVHSDVEISARIRHLADRITHLPHDAAAFSEQLMATHDDLQEIAEELSRQIADSS
jgi:hypothetical protein